MSTEQDKIQNTPLCPPYNLILQDLPYWVHLLSASFWKSHQQNKLHGKRFAVFFLKDFFFIISKVPSCSRCLFTGDTLDWYFSYIESRSKGRAFSRRNSQYCMFLLSILHEPTFPPAFCTAEMSVYNFISIKWGYYNSFYQGLLCHRHYYAHSNEI